MLRKFPSIPGLLRVLIMDICAQDIECISSKWYLDIGISNSDLLLEIISKQMTFRIKFVNIVS